MNSSSSVSHPHTHSHTHTSLLSPPSGVCERGRVCPTYLCWTFNPFSTLSSTRESLIHPPLCSSHCGKTTWRTRPPTCGWSCRSPASSWRSSSSSSSARWCSTTARQMQSSGITRVMKTMRTTSISATQVSVRGYAEGQGSGCTGSWSVACLDETSGGFLSHTSLTMHFLVRMYLIASVDYFLVLLEEKRSWLQSPRCRSASTFFRTCSDCQD